MELIKSVQRTFIAVDKLDGIRTKAFFKLFLRNNRDVFIACNERVNDHKRSRVLYHAAIIAQ